MQKVLLFINVFYNIKSFLLISFLLSNDFDKLIKNLITLFYVINNKNNLFLKKLNKLIAKFNNLLSEGNLIIIKIILIII